MSWPSGIPSRAGKNSDIGRPNTGPVSPIPILVIAPTSPRAADTSSPNGSPPRSGTSRPDSVTSNPDTMTPKFLLRIWQALPPPAAVLLGHVASLLAGLLIALLLHYLLYRIGLPGEPFI